MRCSSGLECLQLFCTHCDKPVIPGLMIGVRQTSAPQIGSLKLFG